MSASNCDSSVLPDYALELAAYHRAFESELRAIIGSLPLEQNDRVLDVGCGDGFYCELIAERLHHPGGVVGVDVNTAFLDLACKRCADVDRCAVDFLVADLELLDRLAPEPFDVVWCAQSLYSFPEPAAALRRMADAVRPGGVVAVLENDTLHQLLLPWPARIEMALRRAELEAFREETRRPSKFYVGRRLPATLAAAGIEPAAYHTQAIDRMAPIDPVLELFLKSYFEKLLVRAEGRLEPTLFDELNELVRPESERYLVRQPYFTMTWINVVAWGRTRSD